MKGNSWPKCDLENPRETRICYLFLPQVYRLEDSCCLFTLQGHSGAITTVYIDQVRAVGGVRGTKPGP